jgi:hypothetical protein
MILNFVMKQQFQDPMDTWLGQAVQQRIMPENMLDTILMIADKHNVANHATGIY